MSILGIDIGQSTIKAVSLNKVEGKGLVLESLGEIKLPRTDWQQGDDKAIAEVSVALKSLLGELKIKSKEVVACMSEDEVVSRLIRLPPLKESEIRDVLKYEAETFVPYPLDQVSIDYEIIEKDDVGRLTLFVIAARNELIQSYIKLFKLVGLELAALESPAVAIKRTISTCVTAATGIIVIDIGERSSDIISLNNGNVYFARSLSIGSESITRSISINLGLDMASAEEYKKAYGMKETELEGKIRNAIMPVFNSIAEEVRKAMALFLEEHSKPAELLVLSGGSANIPGMAEELTKVMGVEVQIIQPFLKIDATALQLPINLNSEGCRFSLAVGLAMRGLL
ncbi:MAG: type IV pilus assembly protein PilM [Candidatus Shapirobacteria bacterium]